MAINAYFGTYTGNPKKVKKTVTLSETAIPIQAYDEIDDLTCDFVLAGSGYHGYNYMKVEFPNHTKYYFIEKRAGVAGNMTKITATCDVLYTYTNSIINASAVLNRTSNGTYVNSLLRDSKVSTLSGAFPSSKILIPNVLDNQEYYYVAILQNGPSDVLSGAGT